MTTSTRRPAGVGVKATLLDFNSILSGSLGLRTTSATMSAEKKGMEPYYSSVVPEV